MIYFCDMYTQYTDDKHRMEYINNFAYQSVIIDILCTNAHSLRHFYYITCQKRWFYGM